MRQLTVGSLFSGIGGIELGLDRAGFRTIWFVECDKYASRVLKKHWPDAEIYGDIESVDFARVQKVDILAGGFPCQDISNAGKRNGIKGHRSALWAHYARAIGILRPKYAIIENVAALINRGLDTVLCDLAALGYDAEWHCIPASAIGALHRRDRIYILAYPDSNGTVCKRQDNNDAERHAEAPLQERENLECWAIGTGENVAYPNGARREIKRRISEGEGLGRHGADVSHSHSGRLEGASEKERRGDNALGHDREPCKNVENSHGNRMHARGWHEIPSRQKEGQHANHTERTGASRGIWAAEPDVGRVAHGVPSRVDRIKCIGNAVVPQVAEVLGHAISEIEARGR